MKDSVIIKQVLKDWGLDINARQSMEELGELIVAVNHYTRGREGSINNLLEEIADVEIILDLLREIIHIYSKLDSELIDLRINSFRKEKIKRLEQRLKE